MSGRAFQAVVETPWAMTEEHLQVMLEVAGRQLDAELEIEGIEADPDALSTDTGERLDGAKRVTVRDGVAVIPVVGPLFRRANLFTEVSGATSLETLARDFETAVESPDVKSILLDVDSPGGEVNGVSEMSDLVFQAREELPVAAFVGGAGNSGAFWIASAADQVVAADTALLGSIGVRMAATDTRERDRENGIRRIEVVSSQSPNKAPDPTTDEGQAQMQRVVDQLADVFVDAVARNRGVDRRTVLEDFGGGRVFVGETAVSRGLADQIGTFEDTLARLQSRTSGEDRVTLTAEEQTMAGENGDSDQELPDFTAEELREEFPEAVSEIEADAREEERRRIQTIHELDVSDGYEDLVVEGMFDPEASAESVSRAVLEARAEKRRAQLDARKADEEELDAPESRSGTDEDAEADEARKTIAAARKAGVV